MDKKKMYRQVEKNEFGKFNSGASPTEPVVDEWRILEKIVDIVKFEERLKITYQLGNENIDFVISAPSLGGIRITTTESSFFNPTEREEIHFIESDFLSHNYAQLANLFQQYISGWQVGFPYIFDSNFFVTAAASS